MGLASFSRSWVMTTQYGKSSYAELRCRRGQGQSTLCRVKAYSTMLDDLKSPKKVFLADIQFDTSHLI